MPSPVTGYTRCGISSRTAGSAVARCARSSGRTSTSMPARSSCAASWCSSAGTVIESAPKSDAGRRTIALDAGTVTALRAHRRAQVAERLAWGPAWQETGKVFVREDGSTAPGDGDLPVPGPRRGCRAPTGPAARPPPRRGVADARRRRADEGGAGDARAQQLGDHGRHVHERLPDRRRRGGGGRGRARPASGYRNGWAHIEHTSDVRGFRRSRKPAGQAVGPGGIEPTTRGLKVRCSAD